MRKKRKERLKASSTGQKGLKTCITCGKLLEVYSKDDYCSDKCRKEDMSPADIVKEEKQR
jgi:predicted nucleic acid-binding Zn ribbon protein